MILTQPPRPPLDRYVETLWQFDGARTSPQKERVLPSGRFQLAINLTTARGSISGMRSRSVDIETSTIPPMIGVVFRRGGAGAFFAGSAGEFYQSVIPLDCAWGDAVSRRFCDRIGSARTSSERFEAAQAALLDQVRDGFELHPGVAHALRAFQADVRAVSDVSREAGISRRRLTDLFFQQVGMTPKLFCRLLRFRAVLKQIASGGEVDWADVALACGYYDQAHLANEFRDFCGMSPSAYRDAERPADNHVRVV